MISLEEARLRVASDLLTLAGRDAAAVRVLAQSQTIDFAIIGFHAQQCLEKCLKAVMAQTGVTYPRTHDLSALHALLDAAGHAVPVTSAELHVFTPYAVTTRYTLESDTALTLAQVQLAVANMQAWAQSLITPQ